MLERKSKIPAQWYENFIRTSKEPLKIRSKANLQWGKNEAIVLMLEQKSKISAKLYGNVVKVSKETLKTHLISAFATEKKNDTIVLMSRKN